jgi:hypothetical protein
VRDHDWKESEGIVAFSIKNNPEIEILGTIGDVDPIAYGGGFVCRRTDGSGAPWIEYFHGLDGGDEETLLVYREDVHMNTLKYLDWVDAHAVAECVGRSLRGMRRDSASRDVMTRANLIVDISSYYGWHELDQYPLNLTLAELCERWGEPISDYIDDEVTP